MSGLLRYGRYVAYSSHASSDAAEDALFTYFATGEISEAEKPMVKRFGKRWYIFVKEEYED
jgi:hypothetical protein